ncbi:MFS transporter [Aphanothece sacrum]|uniref:MFS transporter n=1 Tax=Aphanothece sacrum FPU1 TaxID=1920663 RepID=A0A401IGQ0_APHSA|nr:MFS transporter [Aphanothece sacrum]GBF80386.1 MFS transporter [Aphanothece sacrum FPU1]GBF84907.1 MFS transporter [Aphanothece sacrum FPU3]
MNALKTFKSLELEKQQSFLLLLAIGLLFWMSLTALLPTLPTYIKYLGGTNSQVGFVMGSFAIGLLGSRTLLGHLADTHSRKLVVRIGTLAAGIAPIGYLLIHSVFPLIPVRAVHGISVAAFTTGYSALVVDLSPVKQRGEILGYMTLVAPVGMAIGPALGGWLESFVGYPPLFITTTILGFSAYFLAGYVQEKPRYLESDTHSEVSQKPSRSFWQLLSNPSLLIPSLLLLLIGLLFGTLVTFLPLFAGESGLGLNAGLFYTVAALASFSSRIFSGQASDRYGRGLFISLSLLCYMLSMLLLTQVNGQSTFLLAALLEGTGSGILIPMLLTLISDRSSSQERGRVYSVCLGGFDLGVAIAGPVFGILAEILSYRHLFGLAGSLALIALLLFFSQSNGTFKQSFRFAWGQGKDLYAFEES